MTFCKSIATEGFMTYIQLKLYKIKTIKIALSLYSGRNQFESLPGHRKVARSGPGHVGGK